MLEAIFCIIRACLDWVESCTCHWHRNSQEAPPWLRKRWSNCPCRGHRLCQFASGEFFDMLQARCAHRAVTRAMQLLEDLSEQDKLEYMSEFEHARPHLLFTLVLKFSCVLHPPLYISCIAHPVRKTALDAIQACLQCDNDNYYMRELQTTHAEEAQLMIEGPYLHDLSDSAACVGHFFWGVSSERLGEGGHAQVHILIAAKRNRTEAFDSLSLRTPEIERIMVQDTAFLTSLYACLQVGRNPRKMVAHLGLSKHPARKLAQHSSGWATIFRTLVYHADSYRFFFRIKPALELEPPSPPGPRPSSIAPKALLDEQAAPEADVAGAHRSMVPIPESAYACVKRDAAVAFLRTPLVQLLSDGRPQTMCSCKVPMGSMHILTSRLVSSSPLQAVLPKQMLALPDTKGMMWFSLVMPQPSRAKRASWGLCGK